MKKKKPASDLLNRFRGQYNIQAVMAIPHADIVALVIIISQPAGSINTVSKCKEI